MKETLFLGVDLGGTKTALALWSAEGEKRAGARWPTPAEPRPGVERIVVEARRLLSAADRLGAIGISAPGPVDPHHGVILSVPNLPLWRDLPVRDLLSRRLDAPAGIENDANAGALAEWRHGAGRGTRDMAFLTLSTGIGAGLILAGRLYRGHRFLAGEVGHQTIVPGGDPCGCGKTGCLEAYASGAGIARRLAARRASWSDAPKTARDLVQSARRRDARSLEFLGETARHLAIGIANLVFILDLERIVLGTIAVGAGDLLLEPLRAELRSRLWPELDAGLRVVAASLGSELGDRSALAVAEATFRTET